jgi:hypothetical protein
MATSSSVFVGIDISMRSLEVAIHGMNKIYSFFNNTEDISRLIVFFTGKTNYIGRRRGNRRV